MLFLTIIIFLAVLSSSTPTDRDRCHLIPDLTPPECYIGKNCMDTFCSYPFTKIHMKMICHNESIYVNCNNMVKFIPVETSVSFPIGFIHLVFSFQKVNGEFVFYGDAYASGIKKKIRSGPYLPFPTNLTVVCDALKWVVSEKIEEAIRPNSQSELLIFLKLYKEINNAPWTDNFNNETFYIYSERLRILRNSSIKHISVPPLIISPDRAFDKLRKNVILRTSLSVFIIFGVLLLITAYAMFLSKRIKVLTKYEKGSETVVQL